MMTAEQARAATKERITGIAKEFILNNVGPAIQEAINGGYFFATVSLEGVPNPEETGAEVVRLLEVDGYRAKHIYCDVLKYENYISLDWEDNE